MVHKQRDELPGDHPDEPMDWLWFKPRNEGYDESTYWAYYRVCTDCDVYGDRYTVECWVCDKPLNRPSYAVNPNRTRAYNN